VEGCKEGEVKGGRRWTSVYSLDLQTNLKNKATAQVEDGGKDRDREKNHGKPLRGPDSRGGGVKLVRSNMRMDRKWHDPKGKESRGGRKVALVHWGVTKD